MKRVSIVSKNLEFYKEINNNICEEAKIVNISTTYEECITNISAVKPDVIVIELDIQYYKIVNLFEEINKISMYKPFIIIVTKSSLYDIENKYSNCVILREKSTSFPTIYKILRFIENGNEHIKNLDDKIINEMHNMGFDMKNRGDHMIFYVVKYMKLNEIHSTNLENDIYGYVAKRIGVSKRQIKWNINYSINTIFETKNDVICNYLNIENFEKPTSKAIIFTILSNV